MATTEDEAYAAALYYVKCLLARNYTEANAAREVFSGYYAPGESGYEITHGKVQIPQPWDRASRPKRWVFSFAKLSAEVVNPPMPQTLQLPLFPDHC